MEIVLKTKQSGNVQFGLSLLLVLAFFFIKFILFSRQQRSLMLLFRGLLHLLLNRAGKWKLF